jgi:ABC-type Mn2+/Zn2+ transport system permease subunit
LIWAQIFGLSSVFLGLYLSAEYDSGSGAMIALVAASIFAAVAIMQIVWKTIIRPSDNWN